MVYAAAVYYPRKFSEQTGIMIEPHCARLAWARDRVAVTVKSPKGA